ncbi:MAG: hypothetical protein AB8B69_01175, partial [Chitinophagales bacterium]
MFKSIIFSAVVAFLFTFSISANAQVKTINLEQTTGEFTIKSLTLSPGDYQFEIANSGVSHEVGFVLTRKGKTAAEDQIKTAYVKAPVKDGTSSLTDIVSLEAGEYEYFCPLNPTERYPLTVAVKKIGLEQTVGEFTTKSLELIAGDYQFEIANNGVDHEVGFVLTPKGKTAADDHIKAAYV